MIRAAAAARLRRRFGHDDRARPPRASVDRRRQAGQPRADRHGARHASLSAPASDLRHASTAAPALLTLRRRARGRCPAGRLHHRQHPRIDRRHQPRRDQVARRPLGEDRLGRARNGACAHRRRRRGRRRRSRGSAATVSGSVAVMPCATSCSRGRYRRPIAASSSMSRRMLVSCSARPRWCARSVAAGSPAIPKMRTDSRPTARRHPVAIEVERRRVGGADVGVDVHRHAVDHRVEIVAARARSGDRLGDQRGAARGPAGVERVDVARASAPAPRARSARSRSMSSAISSTARQKA